GNGKVVLFFTGTNEAARRPDGVVSTLAPRRRFNRRVAEVNDGMDKRYY
ncbi:MAG: hypothetical protein HYV75_07730, partial [Opitutae bacterium]|nr:hypothetical protein [Opitutae bacterium]